MRTGLRSILRLFFRSPRRVVAGAVCLLLVDAGQLAIPPIVGTVIDAVAEGWASPGLLGWMALALVGLALEIAVFRYAWRHLFFVEARKAERKLRQQVFDHALILSQKSASETPSGEVMALATNDVESVRRALAMGFVAGIDALIFSVFALAAMFWLAPGVTGWVILPLPVLALLMRWALKAVYERWDRVQRSFETVTERARESMAGIRVTKAFDQQAGDLARFADASGAYFEHYLHYSRVDAFFRPAILSLTGICVAILLAMGGISVIDGSISVGTFVSLTIYLGMLTWPMIAAGWVAALIQRAVASMDRIQVFLATEREAPAQNDPAAVEPGAITIEDLTFSFPGSDRPTLDSIDLRVPAGSSLGIVGEIGSGKSTLASLLLRLPDPPAGTIRIDGEDLLDMDRARLRRAVAWVPQEAFLFSDTIAANLRLGDPDAADDQLHKACELAAVHDEISAFEDGYQTLLGERGITLSGGQKQRVCLARALLKQAPILLLDDTLSAVDADTERAILAGLGQALAGRTAIVISHRISAVRDLDQVAVLKEGRLRQLGSHADLMAQDGIYRRLAALQEIQVRE